MSYNYDYKNLNETVVQIFVIIVLIAIGAVILYSITGAGHESLPVEAVEETVNSTFN